MCCCHDKGLRVFRLLCNRFPQNLSLFCFFVLFRQNGRLFFVFLRNIHSSIEILKIKILEYSYPPSQYFFVNRAFIRFFSCRRKVALCLSGRMAQNQTRSVGRLNNISKLYMKTISYKLKCGDNLDYFMVTIGGQIKYTDHYGLYLMVIHV